MCSPVGADLLVVECQRCGSLGHTDTGCSAPETAIMDFLRPGAAPALTGAEGEWKPAGEKHLDLAALKLDRAPAVPPALPAPPQAPALARQPPPGRLPPAALAGVTAAMAALLVLLLVVFLLG